MTATGVRIQESRLAVGGFDGRMTMADSEQADRLARMVEGLPIDTPDGRAGVTALLRELEAEAPGFLARLTADLRMRRLGLRIDVAH